MPIKIKAKINVKRDLNRAKEGFYKLVENTIVKAIKEFIQRGISPVKGQVRYDRYSESYREQIKDGKVKSKTKVSPVNLTQSGRMLDSLSATRNNRGVLIKFEDKKAQYHDIDGAGKIKAIRRLLPNTGGRDRENFNDRLIQNLKKLYERSIKKFAERRS